VAIGAREMSRDCRYILNYEYQSYLSPTPMNKDKKVILKEGNQLIEFLEFDHGYTIHFEMPKYSLLPDTISKLYAEVVFEAADGGLYKKIKG
jgi:hypothetical protein